MFASDKAIRFKKDGLWVEDVAEAHGPTHGHRFGIVRMMV
jgi:hypothetical protein